MQQSQMTRRFYLVATVMVLVIGLFAGCNSGSVRIGFATTTGVRHKVATYARFTGQETAIIRADAGDQVTVDYRATIEQGSLSLRVMSPSGHQLDSVYLEQDQDGSLIFTAEQAGRYTIVATGAQTKGSFDLRW